ncbi:MAG: hypothetical protein HRU26_10455 [Psychroserpens sp.]|nr:hypothetical protein [Psychroserpens sp.]
MTEKLKYSIENLYDTFEKYHSGPTMSGSFNYGKELDTWNRLIFKKPLRELDEDDLSRYTMRPLYAIRTT